MEQIEKAFQETAAVLLGRQLPSLGKHEKWLMRHVVGFIAVKSRLSGKPVYVVQRDFYKAMGSNFIKEAESSAMGARMLGEDEVGRLSLATAPKLLSGISAISPEILYESDVGSVECVCHGPTQYCYHGSLIWYSKYTGYSHWTRDTDHVFGSSNVVECSFCINVYDSFKLSRCFEVSDSNACTDCYLSHNLENCESCILCFNVKGLRYAVGNREVGREQYERLRALLQQRILRELEQKGECSLDIFTLGAGGAGKRVRK